MFSDPAGARRGDEPPPPAPGRRAFFSAEGPATGRAPNPPPGAGDVPDPGSHMAATVVVECRSCRQETVVSLGQALRRLVPSLWLPFGRYNRLMRCPGCGRVAWCRIDWTGSNPFQ